MITKITLANIFEYYTQHSEVYGDPMLAVEPMSHNGHPTTDCFGISNRTTVNMNMSTILAKFRKPKHQL